MSSASAARKNRRMRVKNQSPALPLLEVSKLQAQSFDVTDSKATIKSNVYDSPQNSKLGSENPFYGDTTDNEHPITASNQEEDITQSSEYSNNQNEISSHPIGKIFIEEERGFRVVDAEQCFQSAHLESLKVEPQRKLAIDLAYRSSKRYHTFSNFCHGLLGGLSLLQCLILYHYITLRPIDSEIIEHYSFLSKPVHNLFNFLCVICCVSAFDRYDIGNPKCLWTYVVGCNLKMVVIILYPLCLVLSLTTVNIDDKLTLYNYNSSTWVTLNYEAIEKELFYWKAVTLAKCVGSILCWIIIADEPKFNSFLKHIENITKGRKTTS